MSDRTSILSFVIVVLMFWGTALFLPPSTLTNFLFGSTEELAWRTTEPNERYGVYGYESRWEPLVEAFELSAKDEAVVRELFIDYEGYNSEISNLLHAQHISWLEYAEQRMSMGEFLNDYLSAYLTPTQLDLVALYDEAYSRERARMIDEGLPLRRGNDMFEEICGELGICPQDSGSELETTRKMGRREAGLLGSFNFQPSAFHYF